MTPQQIADHERHLTDFTAAALAVDELAQHSRIRMTPDEAAHFIRHAESQSNADPGDVINFIDAINDEAPRMDFGGDNPNNGQHYHTFEIGREGSRVVYVQFVKTYRAGVDYSALAKRLGELAAHARADEFSIEEDSPLCLTCRAWWD